MKGTFIKNLSNLFEDWPGEKVGIYVDGKLIATAEPASITKHKLNKN